MEKKLKTPKSKKVNKPLNPKSAERATDTVVEKNKFTNGCGGKKGTKCGVEVYYLPEDSKPHRIKDNI